MSTYQMQTQTIQEVFEIMNKGFLLRKGFKSRLTASLKQSRKWAIPFSDDFPELVKLDSRNCIDESVANDLFILEETGIKQYQAYVKKVLEDCIYP